MTQPDFVKPDPPRKYPLPGPDVQIDNGPIVVWLGRLVLIVGLITWFSAYHGPDDWRQIQIGIAIAGFGITWWILGVVLRTIERK
jgi:hypothetical protein